MLFYCNSVCLCTFRKLCCEKLLGENEKCNAVCIDEFDLVLLELYVMKTICKNRPDCEVVTNLHLLLSSRMEN